MKVSELNSDMLVFHCGLLRLSKPYLYQCQSIFFVFYFHCLYDQNAVPLETRLSCSSLGWWKILKRKTLFFNAYIAVNRPRSIVADLCVLNASVVRVWDTAVTQSLNGGRSHCLQTAACTLGYSMHLLREYVRVLLTHVYSS